MRSLTMREKRALRAAMTVELDRLAEQIESLTRSFDDIVEASLDSNNDDEHDPDGTTVAFERAQIASLLRQARTDREALGDALAAIDTDPEFGACAECGAFIGVDRLLALPAARHCIACAA